jgi:AbrB family looped-hinge helix DNA binding protein
MCFSCSCRADCLGFDHSHLEARLVRRYLTFMKTTVSSKGQIVLPAELREQDHILPGQQFELERLEAGQYLLKRQPAEASAGVVDWLLSCPSNDWFQPMPSESTDDL